MRLPATRSSTLGPLLVLILVSAAGCGPPPATVAGGSPSASQSSPGVTPNPGALAPNDCIAPPPTNGTKIHSPVLGASVSVPAGWAEDPTMEGQQGAQSALDLAHGTGPSGVSLSAYPLSMAMSPHEAIDWMTCPTSAGSGASRGGCTVAGGKAFFFASTIAFSLFPGVTYRSASYSLVMAHGAKLVYLIILFTC